MKIPASVFLLPALLFMSAGFPSRIFAHSDPFDAGDPLALAKDVKIAEIAANPKRYFREPREPVDVMPDDRVAFTASMFATGLYLGGTVITYKPLELKNIAMDQASSVTYEKYPQHRQFLKENRKGLQFFPPKTFKRRSGTTYPLVNPSCRLYSTAIHFWGSKVMRSRKSSIWRRSSCISKNRKN